MRKYVPLVWAILKIVAAISVLFLFVFVDFVAIEWEHIERNNRLRQVTKFVYNLFKFIVILLHRRARWNLNIEISVISHISRCLFQICPYLCFFLWSKFSNVIWYCFKVSRIKSNRMINPNENIKYCLIPFWNASL